jgi:formiminotetrahydrofolate cyclodeaminase
MRPRELDPEHALEAIAARGEAAAAGVAAALTAAAAAALVELTAGLAARRLAGEQHGEPGAELESVAARARDLRRRLLELPDEDADAYRRVSAAVAGAARSEALAAAADPPLEIAEAAAELAVGAARVRAAGEWPFSPDAAAAAELALAAARAAAGLVGADLAGHPGDPRLERARAAVERAHAAVANTRDPRR